MRFILYLTAFVLIACAGKSSRDSAPEQRTLLADGELYTSYWQQRAAEYKALCFQSYNIARLRVDEAIRKKTKKPYAIITDIDETVLDNSAFGIHQVFAHQDYNDSSWTEWTKMASADTVPGAPSFLKYTASKGVKIFYITNRKDKEKQSTLVNLRRFGLPDVDSVHLITRSDPNSPSKEARRQIIMERYNVILLLGDNLADFSSLFDHKTVEERNVNAQADENEFGRRFIVLPNPVYGDWESALYNYYKGRPGPRMKDSILEHSLRTY